MAAKKKTNPRSAGARRALANLPKGKDPMRAELFGWVVPTAGEQIENIATFVGDKSTSANERGPELARALAKVGKTAQWFAALPELRQRELYWIISRGKANETADLKKLVNADPKTWAAYAKQYSVGDDLPKKLKSQSYRHELYTARTQMLNPKKLNLNAASGEEAAPTETQKTKDKESEDRQAGYEDISDRYKDEDLFGYTGLTWSPNPTDVVEAMVNAVGQEILGRNLTSEEFQRVLGVYRGKEAQLNQAKIQQGKLEQASEWLGSAEFKQMREGVAFEIMGQIMDPATGQVKDPKYQGMSDVEIQTAAYDEADRILAQNPDYKTALDAQKMMQAEGQVPSPYTEEQFQLDVQAEVGEQSPTEEFGVDLRGAMDGFVKAIQSSVTSQEFT